ncbi:unnamed protein product [Coregonus sp. 'balchen']|nr:unnamed protein product [Coregonus sp. 'balchen']
MGLARCCFPASIKMDLALLACLVALVGICLARSDAPRGVAVPFVFDLKATCDPPCQHAGICIRNNTCFCSRGYEGETCQYVKCDSGCWNGGDCIAVNGVAKCICPSSWTGSKCQEAVCHQPCLNGGKCVSPDTCRCRPPYSGPRCEERKKVF